MVLGGGGGAGAGSEIRRMDMQEEGGGGMRLSKRFSDKGGEVDYKTKAGTAWSHSYLNQKPWHPLSYPNQRRKWIAEQTDAQRDRRAQEVAREFAQEQEFFRQTALISKKEKEKVEMMKAVSFMYVRPPGYNAESAKAAEIADEKKRLDHVDASQDPSNDFQSVKLEATAGNHQSSANKKKTRPKDVFGRALPTEEDFDVLKNAPRLETGLPARLKPFGVEVRNVKCARCGTFGHQSGDRECPLRDMIMPNEESRLKRDDPLTAILAHTETAEPLKWELKQKPGISPPRGGFRPDDPNQQIVAEDIFDEYGGFLSGGSIPDLLTNFSSANKYKKPSKNKSKHKNQSSGAGSDCKIHHRIRSLSPSDSDIDRKRKSKHKNRSYAGSGSKVRLRIRSLSPSDSDIEKRRKRSNKKKGKRKGPYSDSSASDSSDSNRRSRRSTHKHH